MDQQSLENSLNDLPLSGVRYYESIHSTNDVAAELAIHGVGDNFLVVANEQVKGKGRQGRTWFTYPNSALAFSLLILPTKDEIIKNNLILTRFTGVGALAVCRVLSQIYSLAAVIKWPNDILINQRKVCGVLVEAQWNGDNLSKIIIGIGINITPQSLPSDGKISNPATCIESEVGYPIERITLLKQILNEIMYWRSQMFSDEFVRSWESNLAYLGHTVNIVIKRRSTERFEENITGHLVGLNTDGAIKLENSDGDQSVIKEEIISLTGIEYDQSG